MKKALSIIFTAMTLAACAVTASAAPHGTKSHRTAEFACIYYNYCSRLPLCEQSNSSACQAPAVCIDSDGDSLCDNCRTHHTANDCPTCGGNHNSGENCQAQTSHHGNGNGNGNGNGHHRRQRKHCN